MKTTKLKDLPIGSKWKTPYSKTEGILLGLFTGSADVVITKAKDDFQGDNAIPKGRLRKALETEVIERK